MIAGGSQCRMFLLRLSLFCTFLQTEGLKTHYYTHFPITVFILYSRGAVLDQLSKRKKDI